VARVRVRVFAAADGLARVVPETTEEAQYSLVWPLACALVHGRFGVEEVLGPFTDAEVAAVMDRVAVEVDDALTAAFPARRLTAVDVELTDGRRLSAGPLQAPGEPEDPGLEAIVAAKVASAAVDRAGRPLAAGDRRRGLAGRGADELLAMMCDAAPVIADA
jgi:2-methylcitrate dehydratase PrpD